MTNASCHIGKDWEDAWARHVAEWKNPCSGVGGKCTKSSKLVQIMNDDKFNEAFHAWSDDYVTTCRVNLNQETVQRDGDFIFLTKEIPKSFVDVVDMRVKQAYEGITYEDEGFKLPAFDRQYRACKIIGTNREKEEFDVLFFVDPRSFSKQGFQIVNDARILLQVKNLHSSFIKFQNRPLKSDLHYDGAFRHEIAISDDSFPDLWRDIS